VQGSSVRGIPGGIPEPGRPPRTCRRARCCRACPGVKALGMNARPDPARLPPVVTVAALYGAGGRIVVGCRGPGDDQQAGPVKWHGACLPFARAGSMESTASDDEVEHQRDRDENSGDDRHGEPDACQRKERCPLRPCAFGLVGEISSRWCCSRLILHEPSRSHLPSVLNPRAPCAQACRTKETSRSSTTDAAATRASACEHRSNMNYSTPQQRPPESRNAAPAKPGQCALSTKAERELQSSQTGWSTKAATDGRWVEAASPTSTPCIAQPI
jgi:hypothetical protein